MKIKMVIVMFLALFITGCGDGLPTGARFLQEHYDVESVLEEGYCNDSGFFDNGFTAMSGYMEFVHTGPYPEAVEIFLDHPFGDQEYSFEEYSFENVYIGEDDGHFEGSLFYTILVSGYSLTTFDFIEGTIMRGGLEAHHTIFFREESGSAALFCRVTYSVNSL